MTVKHYLFAKRTLSLIMTAALSMGVLTACSGSTESSSSSSNAPSESVSETENSETETTEDGGEKVIRVCWWGNQTRNDVTTAALDLYTEQNPGTTFEVEFSDWSGYWDKLATQAAGGNLADIIQMDYAYLKQYQEQNLLEGLNKYLEDGTIDTTNIVDSIIQSGAIDDEVYAISLGTNVKAVLVNNDALEQAGVEMPEQPTYDAVSYTHLILPVVFQDDSKVLKEEHFSNKVDFAHINWSVFEFQASNYDFL